MVHLELITGKDNYEAFLNLKHFLVQHQDITEIHKVEITTRQGAKVDNYGLSKTEIVLAVMYSDSQSKLPVATHKSVQVAAASEAVTTTTATVNIYANNGTAILSEIDLHANTKDVDEDVVKAKPAKLTLNRAK